MVMQKILSRLRSIEGVVLLFFFVRLYGILNPPLETWHSWRQTLTNMIARNLSEGIFNLFYPTVDQRGFQTGIIGSEFPFFQALIALMNEIFGFQHWYGRLINLSVCSIAIVCFFYLVKRWFNERTAWFSSLVLISSLWFSFARKTMPDTFAVSLVIIGIFFCQQFIDRQKLLKLIIGGLFLTLGGLCKIPAVFLFALVITVWMSPFVNRRIKLKLLITVLISSAIILSWYFIWVPYLVNTYHFELYFSKSIVEGWREIRPLFGDFTAQFYFGAMRSYVILLPVLLGIIWLFYRNHRNYAIAFFLLTLVFLIFCLKTGAVFPTHNYYVLPFVPVIAVLAGIGLQRIDNRLAFVLVALCMVEGIGNQVSDFRIKSEVKYRLTIEDQLNSVIPANSEIVIPTGPDPQWMYWYHRKGWSMQPKELSNPRLLKEISKSGGEFIVIDKNTQAPLDKPVFSETKDLKIYKVL